MKRILTLSLLLLAGGLAAQTAGPAPPTDLEALDNPDDRGHAVRIRWDASADDSEGKILGYAVWRAPALAGTAPEDLTWRRVGSRAAAGEPRVRITFTDVSEDLENGLPYLYRIDTESAAGVTTTYLREPAVPQAQWYNSGRSTMLLAVLVIGGGIIFWIWRAGRGDGIYLRPVAGLKAFDEAVGRATEMGQPVLFVPGIMDMDQIETLAGVSILGYVARMTARYETPLDVPVSRSLVMAHSREVVRESYLSSGRPDLYKDDMIHYLTDDQFAYAAAVDGIMLRERPAACFYQGKFYAESLILAETGNSIGAIQIAGTASPAQLPFFITACDYTLIGEEFFAASAYLSGDTRLIGSIRGQDMGKIIFMATLLWGLIYVILLQSGVAMPDWLDVSRLFIVSGG